MALLVAAGSASDSAESQETASVPATTSSASSEPVRETVTVAADQPIPSVPGKRLVSLLVDYPPAGVSAVHHHAPSAFIYAYVVSGAIRSQVDDEAVRIYRAGEGWFERPGAHHRVSENVSDTEPARLLAVFIVDLADDPLTIPDATKHPNGGNPNVAAD